MSSDRKMKKIDLGALEQSNTKASTAKLKRIAVAAVLIAIIAVGGFGVYRLLAGDLIASRFTVNKMTCPACVITVKEVTGKIPGVVETDVSLAAQDVTVRFRENQTSPEQIREAIAKAGYPIKLDGLFKPAGAGIDEPVAALVNGKPLFKKDVKIPLASDMAGFKDADTASAFFSVVGKEILLQAADSKMVVVQPGEIDAEVSAIIQAGGLPQDEFINKAVAKFGSKEKYFQVVGQRIGIRKLLEEHVAVDAKDPADKAHKTMDWIASVFKDSDVKILDPGFKETIHAAAGQDEWKTFWPRMIGSATELKSVITQ